MCMYISMQNIHQDFEKCWVKYSVTVMYNFHVTVMWSLWNYYVPSCEFCTLLSCSHRPKEKHSEPTKTQVKSGGFLDDEEGDLFSTVSPPTTDTTTNKPQWVAAWQIIKHSCHGNQPTNKVRLSCNSFDPVVLLYTVSGLSRLQKAWERD